MSALSVHQSSTLPQKIDSREGLFWCKKELVCGCNKTQGKMVLNAVRFAAKCKAKSINIHRNSINIILLRHEKQDQKGQNGHQKVGF